MKKLTVFALAGAALMFTACNDKKETVKDAQEVAAKTGDAYNVDLATSKVDWKAFHKGGFAPRWGTLNLKSGEITVENDAITSGDFVIDMTTLKVDPASVTEADKKPADLEAHLKNADFFDVEKQPTSDFKITAVADLAGELPKDAVAGANKTISGNLTLLGKTLNVSFPAKVTVAEGKASIEAKFTVNRADWGIKFGTDETDPAEWMISKDIEIGINVTASK
ncbi:YceI family protein [Epilithonimonas vandammei]|uniref:YceI family protein n=1 Tax=Epilithonimonas vandammei TaxID=2487072 RepID=A0A3G8YHV6_9FLAO|nr:YceI family protein [Epilithonimonas vandammei]AZI40566.1 YceI family protein [Epilithonimonas vandammei]